MLEKHPNIEVPSPKWILNGSGLEILAAKHTGRLELKHNLWYNPASCMLMV